MTALYHFFIAASVRLLRRLYKAHQMNFIAIMMINIAAPTPMALDLLPLRLYTKI